MFKQFWNDESGVIISAELVLVLTIGVLAMVVGLSEVAVAVNTELNDISNAIGAFDQSFSITGFIGDSGRNGHHKIKSYFHGTTWFDSHDDCDHNTTCDLVTGTSPTPTCG